MNNESKKKQESEQTDGNEFARFDDLMKRLMSVPKKEIDEKAEEYERVKKAKTTAQEGKTLAK